MCRFRFSRPRLIILGYSTASEFYIRGMIFFTNRGRRGYSIGKFLPLYCKLTGCKIQITHVTQNVHDHVLQSAKQVDPTSIE